MNKDMEQELLDLSKEIAEREQKLRDEWHQTNEKTGRDGGPVQEIKKLRKEQANPYGEILNKYKGKGEGT